MLNSVSCKPLYRIYAVYPKNKNGKVWFHDISNTTTNEKIKFIIPIDYKKGLILISYTDGKYTKNIPIKHSKLHLISYLYIKKKVPSF